MLAGAQCNGICECSNKLTNRDERCKKVVLEAVCRNDNGCLLIYNQDSVECHGQYTDKIYQKFTNVCRRGSISNENFLCEKDKDLTIESFEQYSTGIESNCTSIGTQTPSVKDANIQTTSSLESLCESPSELNDKFNSCSHTRLRNFVNYSRLDNSTKASSIESSVRDESTQYCDSCESEQKSYSSIHPKSHTSLCCNRRDYCHIHNPFFPKDNFDDGVEDEFCCRNENLSFNPKAHRCQCVNEHIYFTPGKIKHQMKRPCRNSICSQDSAQYSCIHIPPICHCYNHYPKLNSIPHGYDLKKNSVQFNETPNEFKFNEKSERSKPNSTIAQNHVSISESNVEKDKGYKLELLDEKEKHKPNDIEMKVFKVMKKAKSYDGINLDREQQKPLLSELSKCNGSADNKQSCAENDDDEEEDNIANENDKLKAVSECHCMHELSPESIHKNCIQVRPSRKKSSKRTSPLKIITFMLFASAFLITGSAIKDAYYQ